MYVGYMHAYIYYRLSLHVYILWQTIAKANLIQYSSKSRSNDES